MLTPSRRKPSKPKYNLILSFIESAFFTFQTAGSRYVAWNLHEPQKNVFDFGQGNNDMSLFLDLVRYIEIAKEEDLFVVFRPGPYICSEWDFGGLPR